LPVIGLPVIGSLKISPLMNGSKQRHHRIFVSDELTGGGEIRLSDSDRHYLVEVLRLPLGASIVVTSRHSQRSHHATLARDNDHYLATIGSPFAAPLTSPRVSTVLLSPPKGERLDWACEKLAELGVSEIRLMRSDHSVVHYKSDEVPKKLARLDRLAEAAARQCGRAETMAISYFPSLANACSSLNVPLYYGALRSQAREPRDLPPPEGQVAIAIGPEGGFSDTEHRWFDTEGAVPLSLGPLTLRTETAALVAVALANGSWGSLLNG
jgi:16S rRNA (uracil1498-N3)-methyltransferase